MVNAAEIGGSGRAAVGHGTSVGCSSSRRVSHLPSVEASLVLAFASLEAFIDWCLEQHVAAGAMDGTLYQWIAERDDYAKRPSVAEQFDVLLKTVGRSLKDDHRLWERFVCSGRSATTSFTRASPFSMERELTQQRPLSW